LVRVFVVSANPREGRVKALSDEVRIFALTFDTLYLTIKNL
jgi:hypothetical protein